jgi:hypothetical protein
MSRSLDNKAKSNSTSGCSRSYLANTVRRRLDSSRIASAGSTSSANNRFADYFSPLNDDPSFSKQFANFAHKALGFISNLLDIILRPRFASAWSSLRPATLNGWSKDFKALDAAMLDAIYECSRL